MKTNNLNEAIAAREAARTKLAAAKDATANGRATANKARAEVDKLVEDEREWIAHHAKRLEERARSGKDGLPDLVPTDRAIITKGTAEVTLAAAQQAVVTLETEERAAQAELSAAQNVEQAIRLELKRARVDEIAREVRELRERERLKCALLVSVSVHEGAALTPAALEVLTNPPHRPIAETFIGGRVVADFNSPLGGDPILGEAHAAWLDFDRQLGETDSAATKAAA